MEFPFLKYTKFYFIFSGILVLASIASILINGLHWGIDFAGGNVLTVTYQQERPSFKDLEAKISSLGFKNFSVRLSGNNDVVVKLPDVSQTEKEKLTEIFYNDSGVEKDKISFESVSPVVGGETKSKAKTAILLSTISIIVYVAIAFRKVSKPVKSGYYGVAAVIALIHDVLIVLGLFALLGRIAGTEFSIPILTAVLTVFGYSVNDTVVIFDRIRENLIRGGGANFEETVDKSLNETFARSVNTVLTVLFTLLAIYFFGGESLKPFSLALLVGITFGAYSSIFLAAPLLVKWQDLREKLRRS